MLGRARDQRQRGLASSAGVPNGSAVPWTKTHGARSAGEMVGAPEAGPAYRWMKRVGQEQQRCDEIRRLGGQHRRLPPAVGLAAECDLLGAKCSNRRHGAAQPFAIRRGSGWRWRAPRPPLLPERKISSAARSVPAAQNAVATATSSGASLVAAGAVGQNKAAAQAGSSGRCSSPRTPSEMNGSTFVTARMPRCLRKAECVVSPARRASRYVWPARSSPRTFKQRSIPLAASLRRIPLNH